MSVPVRVRIGLVFTSARVCVFMRVYVRIVI